jgi:hypothetical protein
VYAGAARIEITPSKPVWMDGMLRNHPSEGVHDPLFACALVISNEPDMRGTVAIASADLCRLPEFLTSRVRQTVEANLGIPAVNIVIAAKHIHSGPITSGDSGARTEYSRFLAPEGEAESEYARFLRDALVQVICNAASRLRPVRAGFASGREATISQYRRLLADDGHVVMNWEPYPSEHLLGPLGPIDPELGVFNIVDMAGQMVCLLFNHAGHPNILSGDNYLISAEYPGFAERLLEKQLGGIAMFVNGANGTMDIDGLGPRTWAEMERIGHRLAQAVAETARGIEPAEGLPLRCASIRYHVPPRRITDAQLAWAEEILRVTGGKVQALADGAGDDYKAAVYKQLRDTQNREITVEQLCIGLGETALLSFPGELYTEIGLRIKAESPFDRTLVLGLANGYVGYVPTRKAMQEGGYGEDISEIEAEAEDIVMANSMSLLRRVHHS